MPHTFVIAEAGVNHNGSVDTALEMIDCAADAGADAVKFQTFRADRVVAASARKADYQLRTTDASESQLQMIRRLELDAEAHGQILARCRARAIEFLSSPFDSQSLDLLVRLGVRRLKLASGELTNSPFVLQVGSAGLPVIVSTGMATLGEIETALGVLAFALLGRAEPPSAAEFERAYASSDGQAALHAKISLLHCTTEYPADYRDVNLRAMDTLRAAFAVPVGLSDHTPGIAIAIAAAARGAEIIEKHFTLDRGLPGPDHKASLEPKELAAMVDGIRQAESALGDGQKLPAEAELANRRAARRSLVAATAIPCGTTFSETNLTTKRPGTGLSPHRWWEWLGRTAERDYDPDDLISG